VSLVELERTCAACGKAIAFPIPVSEVKYSQGKCYHARCLPTYVVIDERMYRVCEGCNEPIIRNLAFFEGEPWHYGELRATEKFGDAVAICQKCFSYLTNSKIVSVSYDLSRADSTRQCALCGSTHLRFLRDRRSEEADWQ